MYSTTDVGNIAVWCILLFGFLAFMGLPGVLPMFLALGAIVFICAALMK